MISAGVLTYIPSPPTNGIDLGGLRLHIYGLMIALGIAAAVWLSQRRWTAIGGQPGTMSALAVWGVPGGLIGARIYSLITSWQVDTNGHWLWAFEIWRGGLGIWGGVVGGIALGAIGAHRAGLRLAPLVDCVAPAFALAQAVGRWGNYFNQELYGWKSSLPWAVKIDDPPAPYHPGTTFQPTFLYECIWDLIVCLLVIQAERRLRIRRGYLVAVYAALYTFGRFFTEWMRIDTAHRFLGLRLNDWTSVVVFVAALGVLLFKGRAEPGEECAGDPLPPGSVTGMSPATERPSDGSEDDISPATRTDPVHGPEAVRTSGPAEADAAQTAWPPEADAFQTAGKPSAVRAGPKDPPYGAGAPSGDSVTPGDPGDSGVSGGGPT
ncbi:MAG TPA: prolipoprotein diacylglyceryl transferase [Acidimicrobiales bacterium]|nr:prolipoprotein diacylglyceryl transferase [Acidimicrobiales bacterium]